MSSTPQGHPLSPDHSGFAAARPSKRSLEPQNEEQPAGDNEERSKRRRNDEAGSSGIEGSRARTLTASMERGVRDIDLADDNDQSDDSMRSTPGSSSMDVDPVEPAVQASVQSTSSAPASAPAVDVPRSTPMTASAPERTSMLGRPHYVVNNLPAERPAPRPLSPPSTEAVRANLARAQAFSDAISPLRPTPPPRQPSVEANNARMHLFGDLDRRTASTSAAPRIVAPMPSRASSPLGTADRTRLPDRHTPLSLSLPPLRNPSHPPARRALPTQPPSPPRPDNYNFESTSWLRHPSIGGPSMLAAGQAGVRNVPPPAPHSPSAFFSPPAPPPPALPHVPSRELRSSSVDAAATRNESMFSSGVRDSLREFLAFEDMPIDAARRNSMRDRGIPSFADSYRSWSNSPPAPALPLVGRLEGDTTSRQLPRPSWPDPMEGYALPGSSTSSPDRSANRTSMTLAPIRTRGPLPDFSSVVRDSAADRPDDAERAAERALNRAAMASQRRLAALEDDFTRMENIFVDDRDGNMDEDSLVGTQDTEPSMPGAGPSSASNDSLDRQNRAMSALLTPVLPPLESLADHQPVRLMPPVNAPVESRSSPALPMDGGRSSSRRDNTAHFTMRRVPHPLRRQRPVTPEVVDLRQIRQAHTQGDARSERASGDDRMDDASHVLARPNTPENLGRLPPGALDDLLNEALQSDSRENSLGLNIASRARDEHPANDRHAGAEERLITPLDPMPPRTPRERLDEAMGALRTERQTVLRRLQTARQAGESIVPFEQAARYLGEAQRFLHMAINSEELSRQLQSEAGGQGAASGSVAADMDDTTQNAEFLRLMSETEPLLANHRAERERLHELMQEATAARRDADASFQLSDALERRRHMREAQAARYGPLRARFSLPNAPRSLTAADPPSPSRASAAPAPVPRYDPVRDQEGRVDPDWLAETIIARRDSLNAAAASQRPTGLPAQTSAASARASQGTQTSSLRTTLADPFSSRVYAERAAYERLRARDTDTTMERDILAQRLREDSLRERPSSSPPRPITPLTDFLMGSSPPRDMSRAEERLLRRNRPESAQVDRTSSLRRSFFPYRSSSPDVPASSIARARLQRLLSGQEDDAIRAMNPNSFSSTAPSAPSTLQVPPDTRRNPDRPRTLPTEILRSLESRTAALENRAASMETGRLSLENTLQQVRDLRAEQNAWLSGGRTAEEEEQYQDRRYRAYQSSWQDVLNDRYGQQSAQPAQPGLRSSARPITVVGGTAASSNTRDRSASNDSSNNPNARLSRLINRRDRDRMGLHDSTEGLRMGMLLGANWRSRSGGYLGEDLDMSYESLVRLSERVGPAVAPGVPASVIEGLRTGSYRDAPDAENTKSCSICLEDYAETDSVTYLDNCSHWFHKPCIETWLGRASTCPCCRSRVGQSHTHTQAPPARPAGARPAPPRLSRDLAPPSARGYRVRMPPAPTRANGSSLPFPPPPRPWTVVPPFPNVGNAPTESQAEVPHTPVLLPVSRRAARRNRESRSRADNDAASTAGTSGSVNEDDVVWMADSDSDDTMGGYPPDPSWPDSDGPSSWR